MPTPLIVMFIFTTLPSVAVTVTMPFRLVEAVFSLTSTIIFGEPDVYDSLVSVTHVAEHVALAMFVFSLLNSIVWE